MLLFILSIAETPEDRSKLTEIYDRYFLQMYNYAVSQLETKSEAEDAVQEAFLSLAAHINKIKDPASRAAAGYVMTTLKNKVTDVKRKKKRETKLFGAVTTKDVAEAFEEAYGIAIDKKKIVLKDTIKQAGNYKAELKLYTEVTALLRIRVEV